MSGMKQRLKPREMLVRVVATALRDPLHRSRKLKSPGVITPKMKAFSAAVMAGASPVAAAVAVGYADTSPSEVNRVLSHAGLIERNSEILDGAGLTEELLAQKLREGLDAQKTIAVSVLDKDGGIGGKELIKEPDMGNRHKYIATGLALRGMTAQTEKIRIDIESRNVEAHDVNVSLSADLVGLTGDALQEAYRRRMASHAAGYLDSPPTPAPVYAPVVAIEPETGRKITDLPAFLAERAALAAATQPTVPDGEIVLDPVNGEIIEIIRLREIRRSDVTTAARQVSERLQRHRLAAKRQAKADAVRDKEEAQ